MMCVFSRLISVQFQLVVLEFLSILCVIIVETPIINVLYKQGKFISIILKI